MKGDVKLEERDYLHIYEKGLEELSKERKFKRLVFEFDNDELLVNSFTVLDEVNNEIEILPNLPNFNYHDIYKKYDTESISDAVDEFKREVINFILDTCNVAILSYTVYYYLKANDLFIFINTKEREANEE